MDIMQIASLAPKPFLSAPEMYAKSMVMNWLRQLIPFAA
jgi:hypothetical protein